MERQTVIVNGRETVYWVSGPEQARPMVMVHGFRGTHSGLLDVAALLPDRRLVLPDLPGYGESRQLRGAHTLPHYAEWLDAFVTALGLREWTSWGHSYGAAIGLMQAARGRRRPATLVCVSPATVQPSALSRLFTGYYRLLQRLPESMQRRVITSRRLDHMLGRWLFMTVPRARRLELQRRAEQDLRRLHPRVVIEGYFSALATDLRDYAPHVTMPVLVLAGARDVVMPLQRLEAIAALMRQATLTVMPDQGHLAPIERPEIVAALTKHFLESLRSVTEKS